MQDSSFLELLEIVRGRYFGKYRGVVTEVDAATMRIKAKVTSVLGPQTTNWCEPCVPYAGKNVGIAFLPDEGAGVWIEFEGGHVSHPIWTGCYWHKDEVPSDAAADVKVIVTKSQKLIFDNTEGSASLTISDSNQNEITVDSDGINLSRASNSVAIGDAEINVNDGAMELV